MGVFVRSLGKIIFFFAMFCLGARLIDPATFISLHTTSAFSEWIYGNVNQENFDDLWVIIWILCSFIFAVISYKIAILIIHKMRQ